MIEVYISCGLFVLLIIVDKIYTNRKLKKLEKIYNTCDHANRYVLFKSYEDRYNKYKCPDCGVIIYLDMDTGTEEISCE